MYNVTFYQRLVDRFGEQIREYPSAVKREVTFRHILELAKPNVVLEIGTCLGISTAFVAQYANKIYTMDIKEYPFKKEIWDFLGISHKIEAFIINSETQKAEICKKFDFDLAIIDGDGMYSSTKFDFECVRHKCDRILSDNYRKDICSDVVRFIDEVTDFKKIFVENYFCYLEKIK